MSLRAIAREMGMTAPGLYRYFDSHEVLLRHVCAEHLHRARRGHPPGHRGRARRPGPHDGATKLTVKMVAACHEFRRWALNHQAEFGLLFGVPLPGLDDGQYDVADECALAFAGTFFTLFLELWTKAPFPVPEPGDIDPGLLDQLEPLPRRAGHRHPGRRGADLPALLDRAVRRRWPWRCSAT